MAPAGNQEEKAAAAPAAKGKMRMPEEDINFILALRMEPIPDDDDLGSLASRYTAEEIEERRREHLELVEVCRQTDDEIEVRQAEIRRELAEKGYVEVDDDYLARQEEMNEWATKECERLVRDIKTRRSLTVADEDHDDGEVLLGLDLDLEEEEEEEDNDDDDDPTDTSTSN
ncbi:hypothetical protein BRADI_3g60500v3 [Brachypodium distachyon]|uniref:Uncharacterized protein n=1 Tax=Brachypodium distachyon TaxID=15368 RepID=I1IFP9_BRADI|nr:hypothetical protein BRADI_3g60500v3 [Brachypodium distachyon]